MTEHRPSIEVLEHDAREAVEAFELAEAEYQDAVMHGGAETQNGTSTRLREIAAEVIETVNRVESRDRSATKRYGTVRERAEEDLIMAKGGAEARALIARDTNQPACELTDLGNSERFADDHRNDLCSVPGPGWFSWDGRRWVRDDDGAAMRAAKRTARTIRREASAIGDGERAKKAFKWAIDSQQKSRLEAMVKLAASDERLIVRANQLDADPMLLNVLNATIDLRTGEALEHSRENYITKLANVEYDPAATCPLWEEALALCLDNRQKVIDYTQRVFGYASTGDAREQCLIIFFGGGGNGKTTVLETARGVLGDYAMAANPKVFMHVQGDRVRNDVARLHGARLVTAIEARGGGHLDEVLVKQMTGGDTITARFLYQEEFEFRPQCKIFLATNQLPTIQGEDDAIWDRLRIVKFDKRIRGTELERKDFRAELQRERSGILNWLIEGALKWQREGLGSVPEITDATSSYRADQDQLGQFIDDCCVVARNTKEAFADLYDAYASWCEYTGLQPDGERAFGNSLHNRGFRPERGTGNRAIRIGITLAEAPQEEPR